MKRLLTLSIAITIISVLCFIGQPLKSQDNPPLKNVSNKFVVNVNVVCDDNITKSSIESYIKRELRNLKDVVVYVYKQNSPVRPNYGLFLTVLEPETNQGLKTGDTIISAVFVKYIVGVDMFTVDLVDQTKDTDHAFSLNQIAYLWGKFSGLGNRLKGLPLYFYADYINNLILYQPDATKVSQIASKS